MSQHIDPTPKQTDLTSLNSKISSIVIANQYSTVLAAINAYRSTMGYPFTIQKNGSAAYTDLPTEISNTCEWNVVCYGNNNRITATLTTYSGASSQNGWSWTANIYNGEYILNWTSLNSKIYMQQTSVTTDGNGLAIIPDASGYWMISCVGIGTYVLTVNAGENGGGYVTLSNATGSPLANVTRNVLVTRMKV